MGAEAAVTQTAPAAPAAKIEGATPNRAERKEALIKQMVAARPADEGGAPAAPDVAKAGDPAKESESKAAPFAEVARENKKLIDARAELKREKEELASKIKDADLADAIRKGDWDKVGDLTGDPDWYDKATLHVVGKNKPHAPEVVESKLMDELKKVRAELDEIKNPKPKELTTEEQEANAKVIAERVTGFKSQLVEIVKADTRFTSLHAEPEADVGAEIFDYLDRDLRSRQFEHARGLIAKGISKDQAMARAVKETPIPTKEDAIAAAVKLETALRLEKELTGKAGNEKKASGDVHQHGNQPKQARSESGRGESETTLTSSLHESVPVKGPPRTKEERKAAAVAQLRAARKAADE